MNIREALINQQPSLAGQALTDEQIDAITRPFRLRIFGCDKVFTDVLRELCRVIAASSCRG